MITNTFAELKNSAISVLKELKEVPKDLSYTEVLEIQLNKVAVGYSAAPYDQSPLGRVIVRIPTKVFEDEDYKTLWVQYRNLLWEQN